jgi:hypothetical protein
MMKKRSLLYFIMIIIILTGCSEVLPSKQKDINLGNQSKQGNIQVQADARSSLGKIHLADSAGLVEQVLGKDYKETFVEEPGHFSEPWLKREYTKGISVILGKNSGKVLEVDTVAPEFITNLGAKVGDTAKTVFEQYSSKYKIYQSPHGDKLEGFYALEDGQVIIFDTNKNDDMLFNSVIKPDSKVEKIRLTYSKQLD